MVSICRGLEQMIWVGVNFLNTKMRQSPAIMRHVSKSVFGGMDNTGNDAIANRLQN
jgi:hypothetical protein